MHFNPNERLVILIDGPNLNATLRALSVSIDFKRLLALFRSRGRLVRALYYTTIVVQDEQPMRPLIDWLAYNGFTLVTKAVREIPDGQGGYYAPGDVRVEIAVDAMELAPQVDHIVLVSGHRSFAHLGKTLQRQGKRVTVISSLQTSPPMLSDELRRQADQWLDIVDLEPLIGLEERARPQEHATPQEQAPQQDRDAEPERAVQQERVPEQRAPQQERAAPRRQARAAPAPDAALVAADEVAAPKSASADAPATARPAPASLDVDAAREPSTAAREATASATRPVVVERRPRSRAKPKA